MVRLSVGPANAGVVAVRGVCGPASLSTEVIRRSPSIAMAMQMSRDVMGLRVLDLTIAPIPSSAVPATDGEFGPASQGAAWQVP